MNNRPLVPVPIDRRDPEALSPLSFLCPGVLATSSADVLPPVTNSRLPLARSWHFLRGMLDGFWKRWTREYMTLLQNRRKWAVEQQNLRVGDVVLLVDKQTPRDQWPLGVIVKTILGEDNLVRRVFIRTAKSAALERHVAHVVLLEATPDEEATEGTLYTAVGDNEAAAGGTNSTNLLNEVTNAKLVSKKSSNSAIGIPTSPVFPPACGSGDTPELPLPPLNEIVEDRRSRISLTLRAAHLAHPHRI